MSLAAMKLALETLELFVKYENPNARIQVRKPKDGGPIVTIYPKRVAYEAATALRQAIALAEQIERSNEEVDCSDHPDAPHGFDRDRSHTLGRYVCECEGWRPEGKP